MVIMALDHVLDLMHVHSITQSPTNLETTTPVLFFTRWITYLCAPTFNSCFPQQQLKCCYETGEQIVLLWK